MIHGDGVIRISVLISDGTLDGMVRDGVIIIRDGVVVGIRDGDAAEDGIREADIMIQHTSTLTDAAQPAIIMVDATADHLAHTTDLTDIQVDALL